MSEKERKRKSPVGSDVPADKALKRFLQPKADESPESLVKDVLQTRKRVKERIEEARQEIEDGARPVKGRFRL